MDIISLLVPFLNSTFRLTTPILFAALGELIVERSGVLNLGCEGTMSVGAFVAFLVAYTTGNLWLSVVIALFAGGVVGLFMAFLSVKLGTDQVLNGIAITMVGLGLTNIIYRIIFGVRSMPPSVNPFSPIKVPILSEIPIIGFIFQQYALTYILIVLLPILAILLFKTTFGLEITAVGEKPEAADTVGINVVRIRFLSLFLGGCLAGIGGASMTVALNNIYLPGVIAGRGWIAIAIVVLGGWTVWKTFGGALLFGGTYALQLLLQPLGIPIPRQALLMLPYVATIIALMSISRKARVPSALAATFKRE
jgi:ABC-type uncharacterized transport system permease subunit